MGSKYWQQQQMRQRKRVRDDALEGAATRNALEVSVTGPQNLRGQRMPRRKTRNIRRVLGIRDNNGGGENSGTTSEAAALQ